MLLNFWKDTLLPQIYQAFPEKKKYISQTVSEIFWYQYTDKHLILYYKDFQKVIISIVICDYCPCYPLV